DLRRVVCADRGTLLRWQIRSVAVESQSRRQRQPWSDTPRILYVRAVRPQAVQRRRRRQENLHLGRIAVREDLDDVPWNVAETALPAQIVEPLVENLAADLEVVTAGPVVLEVAERAEHLVSRGDVEPPVAVSPRHDVGAEVGIRRRFRIPVVRP